MSVVSYSTIAWSFIKERRIFKIKTKSIGNAFELYGYLYKSGSISLFLYLVADNEIAFGTGRIGFVGMADTDGFHTDIDSN